MTKKWKKKRKENEHNLILEEDLDVENKVLDSEMFGKLKFCEKTGIAYY